MVQILVVCMGNICRSPMAQAIGTYIAHAQNLEQQIRFDSAGTHAVAGGAQPDPRAKLALEGQGYKIAKRRARGLLEQDFGRFDLILGMDKEILADMRRRSSAEHANKLHLFLDFAPGLEGQDVLDPYFGNLDGFDQVLKLCEAGVRGLLRFPHQFVVK